MHSYIVSECLLYYGPLFFCLVCQLLDHLESLLQSGGDSRKSCEGFLHATCQDLLTKEKKESSRSLAYLTINTPYSMHTVMQAHVVTIRPNNAHLISAPPTIANAAVLLLHNFD